jgi:hypothetical protein
MIWDEDDSWVVVFKGDEERRVGICIRVHAVTGEATVVDVDPLPAIGKETPDYRADIVKALRIARDYILEHGPSYWEPTFFIYREEGAWVVDTGRGIGGDARIVVDVATGRVAHANLNPM